MTKRYLTKYILIAMLCVALFFMSALALRAEACSLESITDTPESISISLYPEKISNIDESKNIFEINYYLLYEYKVKFFGNRNCFFSVKTLPENIFDPQLEIMKSESNEFLSNFQIYLYEDTIQVERNVRSTLTNSFDFRKFPFDQQSFEVHVMALYSNDRLSLESQPIDTESFANVTSEGWSIINAKNVKIEEIWDGKNYDRLVFSLALQRESFSIFIRILLPILTIILLGWASCFLPSMEFPAIIQIQSSTLISLVAFNIIIEDKIPNLSYLTAVDFLITFGFLSNFFIILFSVIRQK
jgi:hypothetical protein